jgi:peptidyl-prolyl cis-trans isomerase C
MKHLNLALASCAGLVLLVGCGKESKAPAADAADKPVATVDGRPISANTFKFYIEGVTREKPDTVTPEKKAELLDTLVRGELIAAEAEKNGIAAQPETRAMLDLSRLELLQQAAQAAYTKAHPATDLELKAEYDTQVAAMPRTEYHARHILVATEDFARKLIERLEKGAKFEELARKESMDEGSKRNDGDLSWFTPERMVAPFADAVKRLKAGEYTHTPVQTQFGWHVIKLDETRDTAPPAFDTVKERLVQVVEAKKFRTHTDELLKAAKVDKSL